MAPCSPLRPCPSQLWWVAVLAPRGPPQHTQAMPLLLEPGVLAGVLDELARLFGASTPAGRLLQNAPDLALSCQSLRAQSRGERDYDYLKDIFSGDGTPGIGG